VFNDAQQLFGHGEHLLHARRCLVAAAPTLAVVVHRADGDEVWSTASSTNMENAGWTAGGDDKRSDQGF
jgi:hypothetical protein